MALGYGASPVCLPSLYLYLWRRRLPSPCCCHPLRKLRRCSKWIWGPSFPASCTHTCIAWLFCALLTVGDPACVVALWFFLFPTNKDKQNNALVLNWVWDEHGVVGHLKEGHEGSKSTASRSALGLVLCFLYLSLLGSWHRHSGLFKDFLILTLRVLPARGLAGCSGSERKWTPARSTGLLAGGNGRRHNSAAVCS